MTDEERELRSWEEIRAKMPVDERRTAAYERQMIAEQRLYEIWERRAEGMDWRGEALGSPIEDDRNLWLTELGERVAMLGGQLELAAVFPDETVTLLIEPGPQQASSERSP